MKIQAALAFASNGPLSIEEIDLAEPAAGDVLVRIVASGLCHTDLTVLANPHLPWPALFGHEGAGVVEKVGLGVTKVVPGDHVLMTTASCGKCPKCLSGNPSYCINFRALNMNGGRCADGTCTHNHAGKPVFARFLGQSSFASHVLASERSIIKVSVDLPLDVLAPLGCGIQTGAAAILNTLRPRPGSSLVVFGAGGVGLSALMAAKISGCNPLIVVDKIASRLELALELGATHVINAAESDALAVIREITGGGAEYAVEAVGAPKVMEQAIEALGQGGTVALVGMAGAEASVSFNPINLQNKGATIKGSIMAGENGLPELFIPQLIEYWKQGLLPVEKMIRYYDFEQINDAIHDAHDGSAIKPVIRMP
ncbi:alcohol dehydrogenase [Pseudomonas poae]|uniref:Alcohol dehydrogenase n=1 Tax=Pseudomonas poae TaxID=200451 RepID=A0A423ERN4_9PSED|nr:NAD(P)-dependent alcohol dehydrogenase [Pseudomonas poae]ROM33976.1 alcohol dehydrogenase [Pseudomonas poae]